MAAEGVRLTDCYSAAPVCSPSRAGLMTGRIPQRLGIRQWIAPDSGIFLRPGETTIAQLLQQAGYRTCHAGKWHLNSKTDGSERTPGEAGFDHWLYTQNNARPGHRGPENFVRNGEPAGKIAGLSSHIVVDEAIAFLEAHPGEPFFLNLWFHETHEPVVAAPRFLDLYPDEPNLDRRHYLADVTQMDAAVGKLLAYLDEHGLRDNTLVFFSSDNGPETLNIYPSAKRCYGSAGPLRGRKLHVTEGGYRVPGILRWPGHVAAGTVLSEPVCSVDLLPTFCAIAGAALPEGKPLDGVDLAPLLAGGKLGPAASAVLAVRLLDRRDVERRAPRRPVEADRRRGAGALRAVQPGRRRGGIARRVGRRAGTPRRHDGRAQAPARRSERRRRTLPATRRRSSRA